MVSTRRFPGGVHSPPPVAVISGRDRLLISTCLVVISVLAWVYLVHLDRQMSSSMEHDTMMAQMGMAMDMPWTAADMFFTFAMWAVMMVGMMTGTAAPMLLLFAGAQAGQGRGGDVDRSVGVSWRLLLPRGGSICRHKGRRDARNAP